jgi:hypothetical protein
MYGVSFERPIGRGTIREIGQAKQQRDLPGRTHATTSGIDAPVHDRDRGNGRSLGNLHASCPGELAAGHRIRRERRITLVQKHDGQGDRGLRLDAP